MLLPGEKFRCKLEIDKSLLDLLYNALSLQITLMLKCRLFFKKKTITFRVLIPFNFDSLANLRTISYAVSKKVLASRTELVSIYWLVALWLAEVTYFT